MSWSHSGQGTGPGSQSAWVELYDILMLDFTQLGFESHLCHFLIL